MKNEEDDMNWESSDEEFAMNFPLVEEDSISSLEVKPIPMKEHIKSPIQAMTVTERCILLALKGNQLIWKPLDQEEECKTLQIPLKGEAQVTGIYSDVYGIHTIITSTRNEHFYLNIEGDTIIPIKQLDNLQITALTFSFDVEETVDILFGTSDGSLYFFSLSSDETLEVSPCKKIFQLPQTIHGLVFNSYMCRVEGITIENILIIMATNDALYQFVGEPPLEKLFEKYKTEAALNKAKKTVPKGNLEKTELKLCHVYKEDKSIELHSFAWKTGAGIVHGKFRGKGDLNERVVVKDMLMESYKNQDASEALEIPESITVSEYSVYLIYSDCLIAISKISHEVTHTEEFRHIDPIRYGVYEASTRSVWLNSGKKLFRVMLQSKKEDLWKQHVESGNYLEALKYCIEYNPKYYPKVAGLHANAMFRNGKFSDAAKLYGKSDVSFEDVVLKFMREGVYEELEIYLHIVLKAIGKSPEKKTQRVMLCAWLVELQLSKLNKQRAVSCGKLPENANEFRKIQKQEATELYNNSIKKFRTFLQEHEDDLEVDIVFQLLQSHGRLDECISFAVQKKNHEALLVHNINKRDYATAIEALNGIKDQKVKNDLMLKYANIFMQHETKFTIDSLSKYYPNINLENLVASIISIDCKDRSLANNYIKSVMERSENKLLYNLHVFFLAENKQPDSLIELYEFLDNQKILHRRNLPLNIDTDFVLNVCKHFDLVKAQIKVYGLLDFYEESVNLALRNKMYDLAKEYANLPLDIKLRKKLWTEIAKAKMKDEEENVKIGFEIINESKILTLGDILPFLSPKMKLSSFKDDLVNSLEAYGKKIKELKVQMAEYSKSSKDITMQLKQMRNSCIAVSTDQYCERCKKLLLGGERFYIFPCLHSFHRTCLTEWMFELRMYISKYKQTRLERIYNFMKRMDCLRKKSMGEEQESNEGKQAGSRSFFNNLEGLFTRQKTKYPEEQKKVQISEEDQETLKVYEKQLEGLLTEDCILCGHLYIEGIDVPFDSSEEFVWTI